MITEIMKTTNKTPKGTYASVKYDEHSTEQLYQFCKDNNIPKPLRRDKYHSTLIYSSNHLPEFKAQSKVRWYANPIGFETWASTSNSDKVTQCLVMRIECKELTDRFNYIMDNYDAIYDFDEYKPHITLSYDVGDDFEIDDLKYTGDPLVITSEHTEDLI